MSKRVIAFDLDGVLAELHNPITAWHNRAYGTSHTVEDIRDYDLTKLWGGTIEDIKRKIGEFYQSPEFKGVIPVVGAQLGAHNLSRGNELAVITARPPSLTDETARWIEKHFPHIFSEIFFTDCIYKEDHMTSGKPGICKDLEAKLIVEDSAHEAVDCAEAGVPALLLTRPWNEDIQIPEDLPVNRVPTWTGIIREAQGF